MDLGDSLNVHYTRKKQVGERLARLAVRYTYKKNIIAQAPSPLYARQSGGFINVVFPVYGRLATRDNQPLTGFELVDIKGERFTVKAVLKKNRVLLTVPPGGLMQKVYYAMQPFTRANLVNGAGLPVSTFRLSLKTHCCLSPHL